MDHGASFPALPLPLVHLSEQVQERLLGVGNVAIGRPAEELELTHHQLALLELKMAREKPKYKREQSDRATFPFLPESSQVRAATPFSRLCSFHEIYKRAGVGGGRGVRERGPCVFITPLRRM